MYSSFTSEYDHALIVYLLITGRTSNADESIEKTSPDFFSKPILRKLVHFAAIFLCQKKEHLLVGCLLFFDDVDVRVVT